MRTPIFQVSGLIISLLGGLFVAPPEVSAQVLVPGQVVEIPLPDAGLPPTLYNQMTGDKAAPRLQVRLPDDYDSQKTYPLVVYVPGGNGGSGGNIDNAVAMAGKTGWIAVSLPLFKKTIDREEPAGGIIVSLEDYDVLSTAYEKMLGRLFERIPNIDRDRSGMVGFSNGAITVAVLVSHHDSFILSHFRNFCLVDQGMFHLADLHKSDARQSRYLILSGDAEDMGRELKIRQCRLQQDAYRLLGINISCEILQNTGHELPDRLKHRIGRWLRHEDEPMSTNN